MNSPRLAIVIPTRNRPDLCLQAVESVLSQHVPQVTTIVSENSGPGPNRNRVVAGLPAGVELLTPDCELAMSEHWDWALQEVERRFRPTHVTFLTDRMIFRAGVLAGLIDLIETHPEEVITYNHDRIDDWDPMSVRLDAYSGDGRLYRMDSRALLRMTASGEPFLWPLPRMLNCVVPVGVFQEMRHHDGHVFSSISPDFYFAYRLLARRDGFLCLNHALLVHHSARRSNGNSLSTGVPSPDAEDFRRRTNMVCWKTPFPEVDSLGNAILHEYSHVRDLTASDRFPPLDEQTVRAVLLRDADMMIDTDSAALVRSSVGGPAARPATPRSTVRRFISFVRRPGRALATRLPYSALPPRVAVLLQRVAPGGVFDSFDRAVAVASARPRRVYQPHVPIGGLESARLKTPKRRHSTTRSSGRR